MSDDFIEIQDVIKNLFEEAEKTKRTVLLIIQLNLALLN
jgi:hypothetical protein